MQPNENTQPSQTKRSHSLFEDPAIAQAAKDDPFVKYMSTNWRKALTTVIVLGALLYAYNSFVSTQDNKYSALSQLASNVRDSYSAYVSDDEEYKKAKAELDSNKDETKKTDLTKKVEQKEATLNASKERVNRIVQALGDADSEPYPQIVKLYKGLIALQAGEIENAKNFLGKGTWDNKNLKFNTPERFFGELGALTLAKKMLDQPGSETQGKDELFRLAENGIVAAVPAAVTLEAIVTEPKEKERLIIAIEDIKARQPEQEKFVSEALERLKS